MNKLIIIALALSLAACGHSKKKTSDHKSNIDLTAAGATFPLPYYNLAFKTYKDSTGVSVTYGGIGSGGGIRSLKDRIVDFAGSDAYLSEAEMAEMPAPVVHIPTCMGAVVMGVTLPDKAVSPVYRSDGSGTTYVFSDYLTKISAPWAENIGTGKALKWPVGIASKGNPGVAGTISQTPGAIGYIGSEYAFALKIPVAKLQNKAGNFVAPTTESISAAADIEMPADTRTMITDSPVADAYPISCFTWILLYQEQAYKNRPEPLAQATVELLNWLTNPEAQDITTKVHYSPLPASTVKNAKQILKTITYNGQPILK